MTSDEAVPKEFESQSSLVEVQEPGPQTIPASPRAIALELEPLVERVLERVLAHVKAVHEPVLRNLEEASRQREINAEMLVSALEVIDRKNADRHKLVIGRLAMIETSIADHEKRLSSLERTRIVISDIEDRRKASRKSRASRKSKSETTQTLKRKNRRSS
jgi:hypothetical protein